MLASRFRLDGDFPPNCLDWTAGIGSSDSDSYRRTYRTAIRSVRRNGVRQAAEAFDFANAEQLTVSACVVCLMNGDIAYFKARDKDPPEGATGLRHAARHALRELEPEDGDLPSESRPLEAMANLRPRLAEIDDAAKCLAMLVELCACQPWFALEKPKKLREEPRELFLEQVAVLLGGDTTQVDVTEIDKILYRREPRDWLRILLPILGGVGIGVVTAGFAAPVIGGAIGAWMGLSGAAAVNAGLAALGGGSLAAGGLGMAGGTALIGGVGATMGGGAGLGAARKVISDHEFPANAVKIEARKLEALVARLRVHGQSSQAKAQQVVNQLRKQVEELNTDLARERRKGKAQAKRIRELEKKVEILTHALHRMKQEA